MNTETLLAVITALGSLLGTLSGILFSSKLTVYRIEELEKKVDKHNHLVERMYDLEQENAVIKEEIKVANHRIEDLERN